MSITDELREAITWFVDSQRDRFSAIADRIDEGQAQLEEDLDLAFGKSEELSRVIVDVAESLGVDTMLPDEDVYEALLESAEGCIQLPKDADGVPFHVGELVDEMLPFGGYAAPAPIDTMELSRGASGYGWMVKLDAENRASISPSLLRHHHEPTVENVLREFAANIADVLGGDDFKLDDNDELYAEYAAKLRLAGDVE